MSTDVKVKSWPGLTISGWPGLVVNAWPDMLVKIDGEANKLRLEEIAPAAVHIKEVNHIDPVTVESLKIDKVSNLDPLRIEELNVTRLPMVNLALRQLPAVDMNIRRLPPVSIGLHQDVHIPSNFTVRARLFGVEFFRVNVDGHAMLIPRDRAHREQARTHDRSYAVPAAVGNPCIPVKRSVKAAVCVSPGGGHLCHHQHRAAGYTAPASMPYRRAPRVPVGAPRPGGAGGPRSGTLSFGQRSEGVPRARPGGLNYGGSNVNIGGL
ncbi:MAG: hypothetical protein WCP29_15745 [Acidobacteriota bacterium]